jgi:hypothetical protein
LALKFYHKEIENLPVPIESEDYLDIQTLRDKFLKDLENLTEKKKSILSQDRLNKILKSKENSGPTSAWSRVSEETARKMSSALVEVTLDQRRVRRPSIRAPTSDILDSLVEKHFFHNIRRTPIGNPKLFHLNDIEIITCYAQIMHGLLNYYRPADNFIRIKGLVEGLRRSCCLTLAAKHKKNTFWAYNTYGEDIKLINFGRTYSLPPRKHIATLTTKFTKSGPPHSMGQGTQGLDLKVIMNRFQYRQNMGGRMFEQCAVLDCALTDIQIHHIRKLNRVMGEKSTMSISNSQNRRISGRTALLSAINRKQLPLCSLHHREFEKGNFSDLDVHFLHEIYKTNIPDNETLKKIFQHAC